MRLHKTNRKGATVVFICFLLLPLLGLLAFAVDYGFLLFIRADLQRAADQACVAAARDLIPDDYGEQDLAKVRATIREYLKANLGKTFEIRDEDIEIGRFNPETIYTSVDLLNTGIFDTVRISVRRSDLSNGSITLYFARLFGRTESPVSVTASAVLQKGRYLTPGTDILPIGINQVSWEHLGVGDSAVIYGDGQLTNESGDSIPGNWGTLDIGATSNSTSNLVDQLINGLSQDDLDTMYYDGVIPVDTHIDCLDVIDLNGDTGFSAGLKHGIDSEIGEAKIMPIYGEFWGSGGNLEFRIVGWGVVRIVDATWKGGQNSNVTVQRGYMFDKDIRPNPDLSDDVNIIEAIYTSPVLVE